MSKINPPPPRVSLFKPLLFMITTFHFTNSDGGAWLPDEGGYKLSSAVLFIDGDTKKFQKAKSESILDIYRELNSLFRANQTTNAMKQTIEELQALRDDLNGFNDQFLVNSELEYGINAKYSFGLKGSFNEKKSLSYKYNESPYKDNSFKRQFAREVGFYYKYSLYKDDSWQISLAPEITYSKITKLNKTIITNIGSFIGHSRISKSGKKNVAELGFVIGKIFNEGYKNTIFKKISFFEGVEVLKSLFLNNYFEYSFASNGNVMYKNVMYEQIGISKEFAMGRVGRQRLTTQIGYYWKKSLSNKAFKVSGPVFSLWMNL